jgi:hypothetical protein
MGTVTAIEKAEQIRQELREYDLAHSKCPVDRRRAEKEAERKALEAREAEQSQQTTNWARWIDQRIAEWFRNYFDGEDGEQYEDGHRYGHYTEALGQVIAEERRSRRKEVATAIEELERRLAGKLVELREHLHQSTPGKFPLVKTWREESVIYQGELISHRGSLWQAQRDTAQRPGGPDWTCVARHGRDAVTPSLRGSFDTHECYAQLDVVEFEGASYIAQREDPGIPGHGEGWQAFGSERVDRRAEVKAAIEAERQSVDTKLEALEQASNDRWATIDQRIERGRESVLQGNSEVLRQFRAELCEEFKIVLEEKQRAFECEARRVRGALEIGAGKTAGCEDLATGNRDLSK